MQRNKLSRRHVIAGAAGVSAATILHWPANAAEFSYKFGASSPMEHPAMARSQEAANKIKQESNGRMEITHLSQQRSRRRHGDDLAGDLRRAGDVHPAGRSARAAQPGLRHSGVGFAFPDYDHVWAAMDGDLGNMLRGAAEQIGFYCLDKGYDHGFRQITTRTKPITSPDDLRGFKIRLPVAPYLISLFRHLGASPTAINFNEVYSALQTGIVDGQENPLVLIDTAKLYEVQKYCSLTNHVWSGFHVSFNVAAWKKLPPDLQEICHRNFSAAAIGAAPGLRDDDEDRAAEPDGQGPDVQCARHQAVPRCTGEERLLSRHEEDRRRQGLGAAREIRRPAHVMSPDAPDYAAGDRRG